MFPHGQSRNGAAPCSDAGFKDGLSFPRHFVKEAERLRVEAEKFPPGIERRERERKGRQALTAAPMDAGLKSPGLQSQK